MKIDLRCVVLSAVPSTLLPFRSPSRPRRLPNAAVPELICRARDHEATETKPLTYTGSGADATGLIGA